MTDNKYRYKSKREAIRASIEHGRASYDRDEYGQVDFYKDGMLQHTVQIIITDEQMNDLDNGIVKPLSEYKQ